MSLLAAVLLVNGFALANHYVNPSYSREDTRSAAQFLEAAARSGDAIVIVGNGTALGHYYEGSIPLVHWGKKVINQRSVLTERVESLNTSYNRLWLVSIRPWEVDRKGIAQTLVDSRYTHLGRREFLGVEISSYRLR
jgi:hypothetical protein